MLLLEYLIRKQLLQSASKGRHVFALNCKRGKLNFLKNHTSTNEVCKIDKRLDHGGYGHAHSHQRNEGPGSIERSLSTCRSEVGKSARLTQSLDL